MKYEITTRPRNDAYTATTVVAAVIVSAFALLAFFGGAMLAHADATTTPVISTISASSTDTTADVTWTTDIPATSQVMYGTTTSYGASSVLDSGLVTNHFVGLSGLTPDTLYHYQILSNNASGTVATSTDTMFTTASTSATSTTPTSTAPVISAVSATTTDTTATIIWTTDIPATSQITYGTSTSYGASSVLDASTMMSHSVILSGLTPSTLYHYQVMSGNASGTIATSSDQMFTTNVTATTSTSTPDHTLQDLILQIIEEIHRIQVQIAALIAAQGNGGGGNDNGGGSGTTTPPVMGPATIDQNGASVRAGTGIDFGGHNFGPEEHVSVTLNGLVVGSAFTNLGGGFSTGSMSVPSVPGTYTYTFTGQKSGLTATAVVTVTM